MAGAEEAIARLELIIGGTEAMASAMARAMGEVLEREVRTQLGKSSHAPGTPTPSTPGSPPAMITGRLRDSVTVREVDPGHVQVGGTTAYARIQELGGSSGREGGTHLPPRPYLAPAWEIARNEAVDAAIEIAAGVVEGG